MLFVLHDVTRPKRLESVRKEFVANVSHELRTPLTSIKGYAQTLKEELPENSSSRKYLETIERNTDRLIALVHDLLTLSSLESGVINLERSEILLEEATQRVLLQLESQRQNKKINVITKIETPMIHAAPKRLEQVMFNLVENAIKYIPVGGTIRVEWRSLPGEVELRVIDNGPGISPEHHARIFERFYRVDSSRTREQGGTGLGLSIVKHIMQRHGGRVRVQAAQGTGSEFVCNFPEIV